jgi:hypothetical protein
MAALLTPRASRAVPTIVRPSALTSVAHRPPAKICAGGWHPVEAAAAVKVAHDTVPVSATAPGMGLTRPLQLDEQRLIVGAGAHRREHQQQGRDYPAYAHRRFPGRVATMHVARCVSRARSGHLTEPCCVLCLSWRIESASLNLTAHSPILPFEHPLNTTTLQVLPCLAPSLCSSSSHSLLLARSSSIVGDAAAIPGTSCATSVP